jgi:hypothetical protein
MCSATSGTRPTPCSHLFLLFVPLWDKTHPLKHLQQQEKTLTPKTSCRRRYKTCFGVLKVLSSAERENPIPNEKNSGLGEKRSLFYLRGERL